MTPIERHCGWLLRAYPAWYRRDRAGEMLGTLMESSPPGRKWPSFRDARTLVTGGLRVRGWTWLLSMLLVAAGAVVTGYYFYVTTKPYTWADVNLGLYGWSADPRAIQVGVVLALAAWLALPLPVLIAGIVRLRGWQPSNWIRAAAWAGTWLAGFALMYLAADWSQYPGNDPRIPSPAVVSWGELAICAAWPVLGIVLTLILAAPAPPRARCVPDKTVTGA